MKKNYLLIVGILILLLIGGYFGVQKFSGNGGEVVVEKVKDNIDYKSSDEEKNIVINNEQTSKDNKIIPTNKELTVKVLKSKNPASQKVENSSIEIYNDNKEKTGEIDLFKENPYLQYKLGNKQIKPFQESDLALGYLQTHLDSNIAYRTLESDKIPKFISITYTAKDSEYNYSSSIIKVFNRKGKVIFNSGVIYDKNYMNPSVSIDGKYLAIYSSIFEDRAENFHLTNENKIEFFNIATKEKIEIEDKGLNLDLPHGMFNDSNLFITTKGNSISIIDLENSTYYLGKTEDGYHIKVNRIGEELKIFTVSNRNMEKTLGLNNTFKKYFYN